MRIKSNTKPKLVQESLIIYTSNKVRIIISIC